MLKVNNLESNLNKDCVVTEVSYTKRNGNIVSTYDGEILEYLLNNWLLVGNRGICLLSFTSAVRSIINKDNEIIYYNPYISDDYHVNSIEELFEENVKMFGFEEAVRIFKDRIASINEYNGQLAEEYKRKLSL